MEYSSLIEIFLSRFQLPRISFHATATAYSVVFCTNKFGRCDNYTNSLILADSF